MSGAQAKFISANLSQTLMIEINASSVHLRYLLFAASEVVAMLQHRLEVSQDRLAFGLANLLLFLSPCFLSTFCPDLRLGGSSAVDDLLGR